MLSRAFSSWGRLLGLGRPSPPTEEERRTWGRIACDVETSLRVCGVAARREHASPSPEERLPTQVRNISLGGINLVVGRSFEPGELLSLALPGSAGEETSEVLVCVVRCVESAAGWQLGGTFATPLSDDDLMRFVLSRAEPPASDQRAWVRFPCQAQAAFTVVGAADSACCPAAVINISASGIALEVKVPLLVGELLSIELRRGASEPVCTTLASVVRTTVERNGDRIAGCNFIRELPEEQVQLLL